MRPLKILVDSILLSLTPPSLQYLVVFGGFSEMDGQDKCFSDLHYVDITAPSGNNAVKRS